LDDGDDADSKKSIPDDEPEEEIESMFQPVSFDFEDVWDKASAELDETFPLAEKQEEIRRKYLHPLHCWPFDEVRVVSFIQSFLFFVHCSAN